MQNSVKKGPDTRLYFKQGQEEGFGALLIGKWRLQVSAVAVLRNSVDIIIERL